MEFFIWVNTFSTSIAKNHFVGFLEVTFFALFAMKSFFLVTLVASIALLAMEKFLFYPWMPINAFSALEKINFVSINTSVDFFYKIIILLFSRMTVKTIYTFESIFIFRMIFSTIITFLE